MENRFFFFKSLLESHLVSGACPHHGMKCALARVHLPHHPHGLPATHGVPYSTKLGCLPVSTPKAGISVRTGALFPALRKYP